MARCKDKTFSRTRFDGMTIDSEGKLIATGNGVTVFDSLPAKKKSRDRKRRARTANVVLGGRDRQTLFITARRGFKPSRMRVIKGVGSNNWRRGEPAPGSGRSGRGGDGFQVLDPVAELASARRSGGCVRG